MPLDLNIDYNGINEYDGEKTFTILPPGDYLVRVTNEETREYTEKSSGLKNSFLQYTYTVEEGEYQGNMLFDAIYLWASKSFAAKKAKEKLYSIGLATGYGLITNSAQVLNMQMIVSVKIRKYKNNEGEEVETNDITKYIPIQREVGAMAAPQAPQAPQQTASQAPQQTVSQAPQAVPQQTALQASENKMPWEE